MAFTQLLSSQSLDNQSEFANYADTLCNEAIVKITMKSLVESMYQLKNTLSFVPRRLVLMPSEGKITAFVDFLGKNADGAESEVREYFTFTMDGENVGSF